jgi:hypothetical protein
MAKKRDKDLSSAEEIVERILNSMELKYDPPFHCVLLLKLFTEGRDIAAFCSSANIARSTFFEWLRKYKEFNVTYELARDKSRMWWEEMARIGVTDTSFNTTLWSINMRNRFGYAEHRKIKIKALSKAAGAKEQHKAIIDELSSGNLTGPEAMQLSNVILSGIKVEEHTTVLKDIEILKKSAGI